MIKPTKLLRTLILKNAQQLTKDDVQSGLDYVRSYWSEIIYEQPQDAGSLIGLPHKYVVPSKGGGAFSFGEQYYWDSFFIALGLRTNEHQDIVEGMLENLIYLFKRFHVVPNGSRMYFVGRSQPPVLTSFIFFVYDTFHKSPEWLAERIRIAEQEYHQVWMNHAHPVWHNVHKNLSRYYDVNVMHDMAEMESGWDMTPRFERKCLDFLPVDLNALLYKYETDFARASEVVGDKKTAKKWQAAAAERQATMNELMWGKHRGFFFDYNYHKKERGSIWSLAPYYTMWAGMATKEQAARMVANLEKFEKIGGLTTTTKPLIDMGIFGSLKTQWAYPNGWAPLHYIVVKGLERYGYEAEARRIAHKWLKTNMRWFIKHGEFIEKYNVVNPGKPPLRGVYPDQSGFGWTNAIFERFCQEFIDERTVY